MRIWTLTIKHKFPDGKQHVLRNAGRLYENVVGDNTYLSLQLSPGVVLGMQGPPEAQVFLDFYEEKSS